MDSYDREYPPSISELETFFPIPPVLLLPSFKYSLCGGLLRIVNGLQRKDLGRLVGGLLQQNRPILQSWYQGGGEEKTCFLSFLVARAYFC